MYPPHPLKVVTATPLAPPAPDYFIRSLPLSTLSFSPLRLACHINAPVLQDPPRSAPGPRQKPHTDPLPTPYPPGPVQVQTLALTRQSRSSFPGLVKDTNAPCPHPAREASAAQVNSSTPGHSPKYDRAVVVEMNDQRRGSASRLPSATSFITDHRTRQGRGP